MFSLGILILCICVGIYYLVQAGSTVYLYVEQYNSFHPKDLKNPQQEEVDNGHTMVNRYDVEAFRKRMAEMKANPEFSEDTLWYETPPEEEDLKDVAGVEIITPAYEKFIDDNFGRRNL